GASPDEYATLSRAFAEAGAALIEANLADPYVLATVAPWENPTTLRAVLHRLGSAAPVPVSIKLPERIGFPYRVLAGGLGEGGIRVVVARNEFSGFEKFMLEAGPGFEVIVVGGVRSGYDVSRALAKGARAVQVGSALAGEGPGLFARLAREMRVA